MTLMRASRIPDPTATPGLALFSTDPGTVALDRSEDGAPLVVVDAHDATIRAAIDAAPAWRHVPDRGAHVAPLSRRTAASALDLVDRGGLRLDDAPRRRLAAIAGGTVLSSITLEVAGEDLLLRGPYSPVLVDCCRAAAGGTWEETQRAWRWALTPASAPAVLGLLDELHQLGVRVPGSVNSAVARASRRRRRLLELSCATDSTLQVDGLGAELRPFQRAAVEYIAEQGSCFIGDEQGIGKTAEALAAIHHLQAWPVVVLCLRVGKRVWQRHVEGPLPYAPDGWTPGRRVEVLDGIDPKPEAIAKLANCDVAILTLDSLRAWGEILEEHLRPRALVIDEAHRARGFKAKRTKAAQDLAAAVRGRDGLVLLATGTPVPNRPSELLSPLQMLGRLDELGGWRHFVTRYCAGEELDGRWQLDGSAHELELHEQLRVAGYLRRRKAVVLPELPAYERKNVRVDLTNADAYAVLEGSLVQAAENGDGDALGQLPQLRRLTGEGKAEPAVEWTLRFLEETGRKLVVFADHIDVQRHITGRLRDELGRAAVATFAAGTTAKAIHTAEDTFQEGAARVAVCSLRAAGTSLTLTAAADVLVVEQTFVPSDEDQAVDRVHRIGQRADLVRVTRLIGRKSIDEAQLRVLARKRKITTAIHDGHATAVPIDVNELSIQAETFDELIASRRT